MDMDNFFIEILMAYYYITFMCNEKIEFKYIYIYIYFFFFYYI